MLVDALASKGRLINLRGFRLRLRLPTLSFSELVAVLIEDGTIFVTIKMSASLPKT